MIKKGFTLIELLVVVAVLALLASIVFSNLGGARERARISNALQFQSNTHSLLGSDLVGWWNFNDPDDRYKDLSGYGNIASCSPCPIITEGVPGSMGEAVDFDGADWNSLRYNTGGFSPEDDFTFSIWVNFREIGIGGLMIAGHTHGSYGFERATSERIRFGSRAMDSSSIRGIYYTPETERWHLLTGVHNGSIGEMRLHVDGENIGNASIEYDMGGYKTESIETSTSYRLGGSGSSSTPLNGIIDDVRIYSRALTSQKIKALYVQTKDKYLANE